MNTIHEVQLLAEPEHKECVTGFTRGDTGFTIQFPNGYGLSVQWSTRHMCTIGNVLFPNSYSDPHSTTAECCEITPRGLGKVHGHCSPEQVTNLLARMARRSTPEERAMLKLAKAQSI